MIPMLIQMGTQLAGAGIEEYQNRQMLAEAKRQEKQAIKEQAKILNKGLATNMTNTTTSRGQANTAWNTQLGTNDKMTAGLAKNMFNTSMNDVQGLQLEKADIYNTYDANVAGIKQGASNFRQQNQSNLGSNLAGAALGAVGSVSNYFAKQDMVTADTEYRKKQMGYLKSMNNMMMNAMGGRNETD